MRDLYERLFDDYFFVSALTAVRKAAINLKLQQVGKQPLP
jgi:hypothetical protein